MSGEDSSAIRKQDSCSSPLLPRGHSSFRPHCVERDNLKMNKGKFQQTRCFFLLEEEEQIFLPAAKTIRLYNYQMSSKHTTGNAEEQTAMYCNGIKGEREH